MIAALIRALAALIIGTTLVAVLVLALGASPITVFAAFCSGAFGNWLAATDTLVKATPLVFTGLAVAIAFQGSLWNIGAEGQLLAGALAAGAAGLGLGGWPRPLAVALVLIAGAAAGAMWGGICGWLRERRGVSEVISTIMLNFVAVQMLSFAVHGPLMEPSHAYPQSAPIAPSAELWTCAPPSRLNAGMLLAAALAIAAWFWLYRGRFGFELRAMGLNRRAARFFGIPVARLATIAMAASGAFAGLGGAVQVSAITHRLYESFSPGWGYEAIAVALLGRLNPLGVIVTAILFGALDNGSQAMERSAGLSAVLVQVIQAIVILTLLAIDTWTRGGAGAWFERRDMAGGGALAAGAGDSRS